VSPGRGSVELLALGISHKTAPVALRELVALTEGETEKVVRELAAAAEVHEAVAISTCNRTELYMVVGDPLAAETELLGMLARRAGIRPTELAGIIYSPRNCDAARQLYRVTSGLESMIVGEAEVQGQVRRAYDAALAAGTTGPLTNRLFSAALQTGKRVRTETLLGSQRTSVSSVAVDLAGEAVGDLTARDVVIIGAGETSELTARALADRGVGTIFVANRRAARARAMAERVGGIVVSLDELPARMEAADIVVSSTSSPHPIVGVDELEVVMATRCGRPLVLIDIAVPRDFEAAFADVPGVTLYDIDDLQAVVARNLGVREGERTQAEAIVEEEIQRFARWMGQLDVRPTIADLRHHGEEIVDKVLAENRDRWESASPRDLARVDAIARAVMQRLLHEPTIRLKALPDSAPPAPPVHGRLQIIRELFGLDAHGAAPTRSGADGSPGAGEDAADTTDNVRTIGERRRRRAAP
jgi:glutamyl-tRNA reductase